VDDATAGATTVFVAHDSHQQRRRITAAIDDQPDLTVVGDSAVGDEARTLLFDLVPDVAVIATTLPKVDVIELCAALHERIPVVRLLLVSETDDERSFGAVDVGARGLLVLPADDARIAWTVRRIARGEGIVTPGWARALLAEIEALGTDPDGSLVEPPKLSPTELEVLRRLASGAEPDAIGQLHEVSTRLVNLHAGFAVSRLSRAHDDDSSLGALRRGESPA